MRRGEEPFQMAPMIDMVFLLLVFFMTVSTLAREGRPEVELPVSLTAAVPAEAPPREVITVFPDGEGYRLFWHNREVDRAGLKALLRQLDPKQQSFQLLLRGPPDLPWEAWQEILSACREAGLGDIVFATFES